MTQSQPAEPTLSADQQALVRARYGAAQQRPWLSIVALAILGALFLGWVVWAGVQQADQDVRWRTVGYFTSSDTSVTIEFDVFKPAESTVICLVRALTIDSAEVGRAEVPVTSPQADANVTYTLSVTERPNTAEVESCRLDE